MLLIVFLPVALYFWLNIVIKPHTEASNMDNKIQGRTLTRIFFIILVTVCISAVSILIYSAAYTRFLGKSSSKDIIVNSTQDGNLKKIINRLEKMEATNEDISRNIDSLYSEILKNQEDQKETEILGTSNSDQDDQVSTRAGILKIVSQQKVDVYADKTKTSQIIAEAVDNQIYSYNKKIHGWYEILLPDLKRGWIPVQFGEEI